MTLRISLSHCQSCYHPKESLKVIVLKESLAEIKAVWDLHICKLHAENTKQSEIQKLNMNKQEQRRKNLFFMCLPPRNGFLETHNQN